MLCEDCSEPLPASAATCRLCDVPQPVECGGFTEGLQGVNPLPSLLVRLVSGLI